MLNQNAFKVCTEKDCAQFYLALLCVEHSVSIMLQILNINSDILTKMIKNP